MGWEEGSEMKRYAFNLFFLPSLVLGLSLYFGTNLGFSSGPAIGTGPATTQCQAFVVSNKNTPTNSGFSKVPGSFVVVNNDVAKRCVVEFSTEEFQSVPVGGLLGTIELEWSIDGGGCFVAGPELFSRDAAPQTRTAITVLQVDAGDHTIVPCYKVDRQGNTAVFGIRCLTVNCNF